MAAEDVTELLLAARPCGECLMSPNRIVSGARAADLVATCRRKDNHFICHKGSIEGLIVHCRGVHDIAPSRAYRMAVQFGIPIREVDPDNLNSVAAHDARRPGR